MFGVYVYISAFIFLIEHSVWSSGSKLNGHDVAIGKKQKKMMKKVYKQFLIEK